MVAQCDFVGRRALIRNLAEEYLCGDSFSKLYVALLVQVIIKQDPKLLTNDRCVSEIKDCGVELDELESA
jgi:hypothetical protein